jgi:hypothetical protein
MSYYKDYFVFPEEFYPKYIDGQDNDPDKEKDWYNKKGLLAGRLLTVNTLERAASFKEFLYNSPEKEIIIVTSNTFINTLVYEPEVHKKYLEYRSCVWKPTFSGRMRLVPLTFPESKMDVVPDEDYSEFGLMDYLNVLNYSTNGIIENRVRFMSHCWVYAVRKYNFSINVISAPVLHFSFTSCRDYLYYPAVKGLECGSLLRAVLGRQKMW